jgi:O-antigen ligase
MRAAAFALLWCFVFAVPWEEVVHIPVIGSMPRLIGVAACAAGVLYVVARGGVRPPSGFHILAVSFLLWAGTTILWSIDPAATGRRVLTYVQQVVWVWLIWQLAWSARHRRALLGAYVLGASLAALSTVRNYVTGVSLDVQAARFAGLNANPNDLGLTLVLGLPMAWYLILAEPRRRIAWLWLLYLPLGITAILLTASRGAALASVIALLIIPGTIGHLRWRARALVFALVAVSIVFASGFAPDASLARLRSTRSDIEAGYFGGRGAIWKQGLEVVRQHPLVGVGAGAFPAAVQPALRTFYSSHQTFLSILVEQGIIGLALFVSMAVAALASLPRLPALEARFSIVIVAALGVGSLSAAWDYHKPLWFVLGVLATQVAARSVAKPNAGRRLTPVPAPNPAVSC